jgi:release factor H-coupled RctB family protein
MDKRITICLENNMKAQKTLVIKNTTTMPELLIACSKKFNTKILSFKNITTLDQITEKTLVICSTKIYTPTEQEAEREKDKSKYNNNNNCDVTVFSNKTTISQDSINQLKFVSRLPDMIKVIGMPDLHPGGNCPIGAVSISKNTFYPHLIGTDIGCGICLVKTDLSAETLTSKKLKKYADISIDDDHPEVANYLTMDLKWPTTVAPITTDFNNTNKCLGTVGAGNHFVELQVVDQICDPDLCKQYNINNNYGYLLVHSGSRRLGEYILEMFKAKVPDLEKVGIKADSELAKEYFTHHNAACQWARRNRYLITKRFLDNFNTKEYECVLDIFHNNLSLIDDCYVHRKGAASSNTGPVVIPGSRGTCSYVVLPISPDINSGFSIAHGAGRKLSRTKALSLKSNNKKTTKELDTIVICGDPHLIHEEAPSAYKDIDNVINDLVDSKLIKLIAIMRPVLTYKVASHKN